MRYLPSYFYNKDILKVIDRLILDEGYKSYDEVDDLDKESLVAMSMSVLGNDAYVAITDCDNLDITLRDLMRYISIGNNDEALILAATLKKNAIRHFEPFFLELFDERFEVLQNELKIEAGKRQTIDPINGERSFT